VKEKWQIKPEPNRGTKITTRTHFLNSEDEADFSDVYLVDKSALGGPRVSYVGLLDTCCCQTENGAVHDNLLGFC
jgi:hypothetical protein